jgi:hypothetical protein
MQHGAFVKIPRKVIKDGSHLCAPNYCRRYRPAAPSCGGDRYFDKSSWISVRDEETSREIIVSLHDEGGE